MAKKRKRSFKSLPKRAKKAAFAKMSAAGKLRPKNKNGRRTGGAKRKSKGIQFKEGVTTSQVSLFNNLKASIKGDFKMEKSLKGSKFGADLKKSRKNRQETIRNLANKIIKK